MAAKKKTAAKTKAPKEKRPPRQFFIVYDPATGKQFGSNFDKKKDAKYEADQTTAMLLKVAGPFVLAERVGQK